MPKSKRSEKQEGSSGQQGQLGKKGQEQGAKVGVSEEKEINEQELMKATHQGEGSTGEDF